MGRGSAGMLGVLEEGLVGTGERVQGGICIYIQVSRVPRLIPSQKKLTFSLTSRKKVDFFADQPPKSRFFR